MSNPGEADLVDLVDALQEAVMAYGRHLVAKKKSIDDVKALMYEKLDYAIVSLQRQNTSTAGAPSRLPLDAGLELCQESDPRGTMIHWKWFTDPPAHQSRPCHHPQHEFFKPVAVIDYATGTECDCPNVVGCKFYEGLQYRVGVGTIDCLGGEDCKCDHDKVMVAVTRWLPHSLMDADRHEVVDAAYKAPPGQGVDGKREDGQRDMWWMELVRAIDKEEYYQYHLRPA